MRSLITYKTDKVTLEADGFKPGKLRIHFGDQRFISLKDLGYVLDYKSRPLQETIDAYNNFLKMQQCIYLRVGLTRLYDNNVRRGFWLQVNGVYSFPRGNPEVRRYA